MGELAHHLQELHFPADGCINFHARQQKGKALISAVMYFFPELPQTGK